jgi:hypothetical protein
MNPRGGQSVAEQPAKDVVLCCQSISDRGTICQRKLPDFCAQS